MDKKSIKTNDLNLRNVTKALHVSKHDIFVFICIQTVKCPKMKKKIVKNLSLSIKKGLISKLLVSN